MRRLTCMALLVAIGLFSSAAHSADAWASWPNVQVPDSVPADEVLHLKQLWRLDCGEATGDLVGRITAAAPGLNGSVLLLDSQLSQVLVVSSSGAIERVCGQRGEGPGDWPGAFRVIQLPDGKIGVSGGTPPFTIQVGGTGKIVFLDASGEPAGLWFGAGDPGTMPVCSVRELRNSSGNILVASQGMKFGKSGAVRTEELAILSSSDGERTVVFGRDFVEDMNSLHVDEAEYFEPFAHGRCDISDRGCIAFAPRRDEWLVVVRNPDETGYSLSRDLPATERTEAAKNAMRAVLGGIDNCSVLETEPVVGRVRWRPGGNLWVEPIGQKSPVQAIACFDELSPDGNLLRRVHLVAPNLRGDDELLVLEDGRFILLSGFGTIEDEADTTTDGHAEVALLVIE